MVTKKSNDVHESEFIPSEEVFPLSDLHGLQEKDMLSVVVSGILSRALIREQVNEVLKTKTVKVSEKEVKEEFVYSDSVIISVLSAAIKKVLLLECAKAKEHALYFTTYRGMVCLDKQPSTANDTEFKKSDEKHISVSGIIAHSYLRFIPWNVNNGKLAKEDINTLDGTKLAVMIVEAVGISVFRQKIVSQSNLTSNLTDDMKEYIRDFEAESPRPIVLIMNELKADSELETDKRMKKEDYLADIQELAMHIKNEAKKAGKLANTRSRMVVPNICFALMERFKRVEKFD